MERLKSQNKGEQEGKDDYMYIFDDFPNCWVDNDMINMATQECYDLLLKECLDHVTYSDVLRLRMFGVSKYSRFNWSASKGTSDHANFMRANKRSIYRHLVAHQEGEVVDPESGCLHLACVALRCMIAIEYSVSTI